jgi:predicted patatin/cPLA2 family phospholipase
MKNLILTNTLKYKNYKTEVLTEKKLKEFLMSESIPCLSSRFQKPEEFYERILFQIPKTKKYKKYKMIYSHLILKLPDDFKTKTELAKMHNIPEEKIIAEGSITLMDVSLEIKPQVRWLIMKE